MADSKCRNLVNNKEQSVTEQGFTPEQTPKEASRRWSDMCSNTRVAADDGLVPGIPIGIKRKLQEGFAPPPKQRPVQTPRPPAGPPPIHLLLPSKRPPWREVEIRDTLDDLQCLRQAFKQVSARNLPLENRIKEQCTILQHLEATLTEQKEAEHIYQQHADAYAAQYTEAIRVQAAKQGVWFSPEEQKEAADALCSARNAAAVINQHLEAAQTKSAESAKAVQVAQQKKAGLEAEMASSQEQVKDVTAAIELLKREASLREVPLPEWVARF